MKSFTLSLIIIFTCYLLSYPINQDNFKSDSLINLIKKSSKDTSRVNLYIKLGEVYMNSDVLESENVLNKAKELSIKLDYKQGLANTYNKLGWLFYRQGKSEIALNHFNSALDIFTKLGRIEGIIDMNNNIGIIYDIAGKYEESRSYYQHALQMAIQLKDEIRIADSYANIGTLFYYQGNFDSALFYHKEALQLNPNKDDGYIFSLNVIGNILCMKGEFKQSLTNYMEMLAILEKNNNQFGIASSLINIGNIHIEMSNYDNAIKYLNKALKIKTNLKDNSGIALIHLNLATCYSDLNIDDTAKVFILKSIKLFEEQNDKQNLAIALSSIGDLYTRHNNYKQAIEALNQSSKILNEIQDSVTLGKVYRNLSTLYLKINSPETSIFYADQCLKIGLDRDMIPAQSEAYNNLSEAYEHLKNYNKAFKYYKKHIELKDSIFNQEKNRQIQEIETKYQTEKKEQEIKLQKSQLAKKEVEIKQQRTQKYAFIGGFILVAILGLVVLRNFQQKKKANVILEKQRDMIFKQKENITDSIKYAKRIQSAVLPPTELISEHIPNHFILFKPRDIVSGDFYWMKHVNNHTLITAADCTGHGVPGAFMSMLGVAFLNEIVRKKEITKASEVLNELRDQVKLSLRQTGKEGETKDGMDISFCSINKEEMKLQFAGAYNPLYLIRKKYLTGFKNLLSILVAENDEYGLFEIKGDKMPIGIHAKEKDEFTNHELKIYKDDAIYLFSDGYVDQFGGEKNRKFMAKPFKKLLLDIQNKSMIEQHEILDKTIENWKAHPTSSGLIQEQMDDITIIGIKI